MANIPKLLDAEGVAYLWQQISLEDYPNNDLLVDVLESIDEVKADKDKVVSYIDEQNVTEEQQMQARKNQGLYSNSKTLLDMFDMVVTDGVGYHRLENLNYDGESHSVIVVVSYADGRPFVTMEGSYSYMGYPVDTLVLDARTNEGNFVISYVGGDNSWNCNGVQSWSDGTYKITVYEIELIQIPEEFIPMIPQDKVEGLSGALESAVSINPQELTEVQQMQARTNLGLYSKREEYILVEEYTYGPCYKGVYEIDFAVNNKSFFDVKIAGDTTEVEYRLHRKVSGDCTYYGNPILLNEYDTPYKDHTFGYPSSEAMCLYLHDNKTYIVFDPSRMNSSYHNNHYIFIGKKQYVTVYDLIPNEYISEDIARTSDIPVNLSQLNNDIDAVCLETSYGEEIVVLDETVSVSSENVEILGWLGYGFILPDNFVFSKDMIYSWNINDGTDVEDNQGVLAIHWDEETDVEYIGTFLATETDTTYKPMIVYTIGESGGGYYMCFNQPIDFNIQFSMSRFSKQISEEYIPDTIARTNDVVQSDWDETDETSMAFIKNKPDENDALELVAEMGLVTPTAAADGSIYTDENGTIYSL